MSNNRKEIKHFLKALQNIHIFLAEKSINRISIFEWHFDLFQTIVQGFEEARYRTV